MFSLQFVFLWLLVRKNFPLNVCSQGVFHCFWPFSSFSHLKAFLRFFYKFSSNRLGTTCQEFVEEFLTCLWLWVRGWIRLRLGFFWLCCFMIHGYTSLWSWEFEKKLINSARCLYFFKSQFPSFFPGEAIKSLVTRMNCCCFFDVLLLFSTSFFFFCFLIVG